MHFPYTEIVHCSYTEIMHCPQIEIIHCPYAEIIHCPYAEIIHHTERGTKERVGGGVAKERESMVAASILVVVVTKLLLFVSFRFSFSGFCSVLRKIRFYPKQTGENMYPCRLLRKGTNNNMLQCTTKITN